jgi:hypothetical protein
MKSVNDIDLKGFKVNGWKCSCGNVHTNPKDVDDIVKFFRYMKTSKEIKVFKSGNSLAIRIPKQIADLYHLTQKSKLILIPKDDKLILEIASS